ncbi:protein FAM124A-like isoform X2 [Tubulanus polymorphus]|uniref:protein FAM124A-like isoform X2 n=1 Tax=Tubulanus polymorphus TaxID=672921 RepID=UPI003DA5AD55
MKKWTVIRSHRDSDGNRSLSSNNSSFSSEGTGTPFYSSLDSSSISDTDHRAERVRYRPVGGACVRLSVHPRERAKITDYYRQILNWVKPELPLVHVDSTYTHKLYFGRAPTTAVTSQYPSLAIVVFIKEPGLFASKRLNSINKHFNCAPWCLHHSDSLNQSGLRTSDENKLDYFCLSSDLPLCAFRVVHCGKERVRFTRFVSKENWDDMLELYKLIIGHQPVLQRPHFYLFAVSSFPHYDLQFALKLHDSQAPPLKRSDSVTIEFNITGGIGSLVPLLPHVCTQQSDNNRWQTIDHDGNRLQFNVINRSRSRSIGSLTSPSSLQSVLTSSPSGGFFV